MSDRDDNNAPVTKREFRDFVTNHHNSLKEKVDQISGMVHSIRGQMKILIPLIVTIAGMIAALIAVAVVS